jgi:hypothetical protein
VVAGSNPIAPTRKRTDGTVESVKLTRRFFFFLLSTLKPVQLPSALPKAERET